MTGKKILLISIVVILIVLIFFVWSIFPTKKDKQVEKIVSIEERFSNAKKESAMSGKFAGLDQVNSLISLNSYDQARREIETRKFRIDKNTIYSEDANEYDAQKIISVNDIKSGDDIKVYFKNIYDDLEQPVVTLVQVIKPEVKKDSIHKPIAPNEYE